MCQLKQHLLWGLWLEHQCAACVMGYQVQSHLQMRILQLQVVVVVVSVCTFCSIIFRWPTLLCWAVQIWRNV